MRWRIQRIVNGSAAQQLVARQDVVRSSLFLRRGPVGCTGISSGRWFEPRTKRIWETLSIWRAFFDIYGIISGY